MRQASPYRTGAARIGYTNVAERTWAAPDDNRKAALEGNDRIEPPTADQFVGNAVQIIGKLSAFAEGQVDNRSDHQALRNIERIQATLIMQVVCIGIIPAHRRGFQPIDFGI